MFRKAFILMLAACLSVGICVSTIVGRVPEARASSSVIEPETTAAVNTSPVINMGDPEVTTSQLSLSCDSSAVIAPTLSEDDDVNSLEWTSSDSTIVCVDDGGKADALKEGNAVVTAESEKTIFKYNITVTPKENPTFDGYSTCIIANTEALEKNLVNKYEKNPYCIKVNRKQNCVTVYTYDEEGEYTVPIRAMICSCGLDGATVTGEFSIYFKNEWNALFGDVYGHYVSGFYGNYLFHSVPYYYASADTLEVEEYNKLGEDASMGCVRMQIADVKWIYENCEGTTPVIVYDDDNPGPLGKPEAIKITDMSCGWDPTDDNTANPYNGKTPQISGAQDIKIKRGADFQAFDNVTATDTCGNDITDKIIVTCNVITEKKGTYSVTYYVEDAMHRSAKTAVTVTVE